MDDDQDLADRLRQLPVFAGALPTLDVGALPADPVALFRSWIDQAIAAGVREPHAMTLATVDAAGGPNVRTLILKGVASDGGWRFAGSRATGKGDELSATGAAAASFYWPALGRQVRLRGPVRDRGPEASAADFRARSASARAETLVGRQGRPLDDTRRLDEELERSRRRLAEDPDVVASSWTSWEIVADEVEFLQGDAQRRHVRVAYAREGDGWRRRLLWP